MNLKQNTKKRKFLVTTFLIAIISLIAFLPIYGADELTVSMTSGTDLGGCQSAYTFSVTSATYLPVGTRMEIQFSNGYVLSENDDFKGISLSGNNATGSEIDVVPNRSEGKLTLSVKSVNGDYLNQENQNPFQISIPTGIFNPPAAGSYTITLNLYNSSAQLISTKTSTMTINMRTVSDRLDALNDVLDQLAKLSVDDCSYAMDLVEREIDILWDETNPILSTSEITNLESNGVSKESMLAIINAFKNYLDSTGNGNGTVDVAEWETFLDWIQPLDMDKGTFRDYDKLETMYNEIRNSVSQNIKDSLHESGLEVDDLIDAILRLNTLNLDSGLEATGDIQGQVNEILTENVPIALQKLINNGLNWTNYREVISRLTVKEKSKIEKMFYFMNRTKSVRPYADLDSGSYNGEQIVTLTNEIPAANIYYSIGIDSDPKTAGTLYEKPIAVSQDATIKAVAVIDNVYSTIVTYDYEIVNTVIHVNAVSVSETTLSLIEHGATAQLTASIDPVDATDKRVTWSSDNESVVTVTYNEDTGTATITPVGSGTANVTAITVDGSKTATCIVTVNPQTVIVHVNAVSVSETTLSLIEHGATAQLTATIDPVDATDKRVRWSSDNESVVTVTYNEDTGTVTITPVGSGTANVTAITVDGSKTATCIVTVNPQPQPTYTLQVVTDKEQYYLNHDNVMVSVTVYADGNPVSYGKPVSLSLLKDGEVLAVAQPSTDASGNVKWIIPSSQFVAAGVYTVIASSMLTAEGEASFEIIVNPQPTYTLQVVTDKEQYYLNSDNVTVSVTVYADGNPVSYGKPVSLSLLKDGEVLAVAQPSTDASGNVKWIIPSSQFTAAGVYTVIASSMLTAEGEASINIIPVNNPTIRIKGRVLLEGDNTKPTGHYYSGGVKIEIKQDGVVKYTGYTSDNQDNNLNGEFEVTDLLPGTYTVVLSKPGYLERTFEITANSNVNLSSSSIEFSNRIYLWAGDILIDEFNIVRPSDYGYMLSQYMTEEGKIVNGKSFDDTVDLIKDDYNIVGPADVGLILKRYMTESSQYQNDIIATQIQ